MISMTKRFPDKQNDRRQPTLPCDSFENPSVSDREEGLATTRTIILYSTVG